MDLILWRHAEAELAEEGGGFAEELGVARGFLFPPAAESAFEKGLGTVVA